MNHGASPCTTVDDDGCPLPEDVSRRLRGLARGVVTLAEGGDIETALTLVDQLRDVLEGARPRVQGPTVWEILAAEE